MFQQCMLKMVFRLLWINMMQEFVLVSCPQRLSVQGMVFRRTFPVQPPICNQRGTAFVQFLV